MLRIEKFYAANPNAVAMQVFAAAIVHTAFRIAQGNLAKKVELINVLERFLAVRPYSFPNGAGIENFRAELSELCTSLDRAQTEGLHLDRRWGELKAESLGFINGNEPPQEWWENLHRERQSAGPLVEVLQQFERTQETFQAAQKLLRPWVIRHIRSRTIASESGPIDRRVEFPGRAILDGVSRKNGLVVQAEARFPFLLCARAQSILTRQRNQRAYFAEGLASSYGAFLETSEGKRPAEDPDIELDDARSGGDVSWYIRHLKRFLGDRKIAHPKIEATAKKVLELWLTGEKVLVFGHCLKTISDLKARLDKGVERGVDRLAIRHLRLAPDAREEARSRVGRIVHRLQDRDSPLRLGVEEILKRWVKEEKGLTPGHQELVVKLLLGTLATSSFVVCNFPLDREEVRKSLEDDRATATQARHAANAVAGSLARRRGTRLAYKSRVKSFLWHMVEDFSNDAERENVLQELLAADKDVVRHASGDVKPETRRRVLLGFNSPLLPEILVASEVLAEGLDLHLDCRHVIHHDLSWNPSTLEQRTGRIDRLWCLAEQEGRSIEVYLPYLEGTADEKMYRVVMDRMRWFQVIMGEKYEVDERSTERLENRVPFPAEAVKKLSFDLSVSPP